MPKRTMKTDPAKQSGRRSRSATATRQSGNEDARPSAELKEMCKQSLDGFLEALAEGQDLPALSFHYRSEDHTIIMEGKDGVIDAGLVDELRKALVETCPSAARYVLAYDGFLTTDGVKNDAVVLEAGDRGNSVAFLFAHRYRLDPKSNAVELIGGPEFIGNAPSALGSAAATRRAR